jgi:hypothetical protein
MEPEEDYATCAQCSSSTDPVSNIRAMPDEEARSLWLHFKFNEFYEQWDESHPADRLSTKGLPDYEPTLPTTAEAVP